MDESPPHSTPTHSEPEGDATGPEALGPHDLSLELVAVVPVPRVLRGHRSSVIRLLIPRYPLAESSSDHPNVKA